MQPATAILRPHTNGQITIPAAIRRALGITDTSFLNLRLEGDRIVISRVRRQPDGIIRLFPDDLGSPIEDEAPVNEPIPLWLDIQMVGNA
jgi:AbrB family looped-hinge helix DNA binding protein